MIKVPKILLFLAGSIFIFSCQPGNGNIGTEVMYNNSEIKVKKNLKYSEVRNFDNTIGIWEEELGMGRILSNLGNIITSQIENVLDQSIGWKSPLKFDFYSPNIESYDRPLIIFIHGGGFVYGNRFDEVCEDFCKTMAKYGYACASIDYRKMNILTPSFIKAGYVATQDALSAFQYFVENSVQYGIDPNKIVLAGISSGAITSLNCAYLLDGENLYDRDDKLNEMYGSLRKTEFTELKPAAVINISGAINDLRILNDDVPVISFHGTNDDVLKIDCGLPFEGLSNDYNNLFNRMNSLFSSASPQIYEYAKREFDEAKMLPMCGANEIHTVLEKNYVYNKLVVYDNQDHYLYWSRNSKRTREGDRIIKEITYFLYEIL